jgi:hypothetical protein
MMTEKEILRQRLINQQIGGTKFSKPEELVSYMGAMQAQEFHMVKWAIGLRVPGIKEQDVESSFNKGRIIRTHLLRPTWHFVSPQDLRYILALTAPRVHALNAYMYRKTELTPKILKKSADVLVHALQDHNYLTREKLKDELENSGIIAEGLRLIYIMMHAELEGLICSGPRKGKQFTYALLEEWVKPQQKKSRDEALIALLKKYFTSRGPVSLKDFVYWSGLTVAESKKGLEEIKNDLNTITFQGTTYYFKDLHADTGAKVLSTFLMPEYDEYGMSYKDRNMFKPAKLIDPKKLAKTNRANHILTIDGKFAGLWQRGISGSENEITTALPPALTRKQNKEVSTAIQQYRDFFS